MVHSTGANNPNLKRYVGPDDGLLGKNQYGNHWSTYHPGGREVCVHAFIGKLADGTIATYQTLPWNHRGWHAGGSANNTHIGFEICEDGLTDYAYFKKVYREAVELCAYLCKEYGLTEQNIICHSEGYKQDVASNHGDVMHWFPKHGKSMDTFRAEVKALLAVDTKEDTEDTAEPVVTYPEKLTSGYYRVRKTWKDSKSQVGAYRILSNAKTAADKNPGTFVFANDGTAIYPADETAEPDYRIHTVVKGDTLWEIAERYLGKGARYTEIKKLNGLTSNVIYSGSDGTTAFSYAEPKAIPGAVSISLDAEGETSPFYADGIVYFRSVTNNGYSGDLEIALIPEWFRTEILQEKARTGDTTDSGTYTNWYKAVYTPTGEEPEEISGEDESV